LAALLGDAVRLEVASGCSVEDLNDSLLNAVQAGDPDLARLSLERGADPNATFDEADDVLGVAVIEGNAELVRLLLDAGARPNVRRWSGITSLLGGAE
jgi:uncharacterized protein